MRGSVKTKGSRDTASDDPTANNSNEGNIQQEEAYVPQVESSTTSYEIYGTAIAVGEDTFTQVDSSTNIVKNKAVTVAKINITAKAYAQSSEGETAHTSAYTDVNTDADIMILHNFLEGTATIDGQSYDVSKAKCVAITLPSWVDLPGGSKKIVKVIENDSELQSLDLNGNVAVFSVEAQVTGKSTYLSADLYAFSTDTLSYSYIDIYAEV